MALKISPHKNEKKHGMDSKKDSTDKSHENQDKKSAKKKTTHKQMEPTRFAINHTINQTILPTTSSCCYTYPSFISLPPVPVVTMSPYSPPYGMNSFWPEPSWTSFIPSLPPVPTPIYSVAMPTVPVPLMQPQILPTQVCPYTTLVPPPIVTEPLLPIVTTACPFNITVSSPNASFYVNDCAVPVGTDLMSQVNVSNMTHKLKPFVKKPLNSQNCLALPKELFPSARMLRMNPNAIIDWLCREKDIVNHSPWLLDLEFGVPRAPITRPIAIYDVQFNSIHCKNTPGAIHPGFESCSEDFKRVMLFYYDCIISSWYKGFIAVNSDTSVANFQSWLQIPMQVYGMCWP